MHFPTDRRAHATAFDGPVVDWLGRKIKNNNKINNTNNNSVTSNNINTNNKTQIESGFNIKGLSHLTKMLSTVNRINNLMTLEVTLCD